MRLRRPVSTAVLWTKGALVPKLEAVVQGIVQGVGYRATARWMARRLNLTGWVRNLPDGSVETHAYGDKTALDQFARWLHKGPENARVTLVTIQRSEETSPFDSFEIRYDADW
ncbi:acylphosphatase [Anaerolineae bacterium]|nr:acylphosphatase [Anaerolineae bacterium]